MKIGVPNGTYYRQIWLAIEDGGSGTWLWAVRQGLCYLFIEIIDLPDACGRDADAQWAAQVHVVDLASISQESITGAMDSFGVDDPPDMTTEAGRLELACICRGYGAHAPMWNSTGGPIRNVFESGNENDRAFRRLRKEAREFAEGLFDETIRESELDSRVVNTIGHTAREYMAGGDSFWAPMRRVRDNPDAATPEQSLVLGLYAKCGATLGGTPVPQDLKE